MRLRKEVERRRTGNAAIAVPAVSPLSRFWSGLSLSSSNPSHWLRVIHIYDTMTLVAEVGLYHLHDTSSRAEHCRI